MDQNTTTQPVPSPWTTGSLFPVGIAGGVTVLLHVALIRAGVLDVGTGAVLACVNGFAVWHGFGVCRRGGTVAAAWYLAGYAALMAVFGFVARSPLLFAAFGMLYAASFRVSLLLGYVLILAGCVAFVTPYYLQIALLLGGLYTIVLHLHSRRAARFQLFCLAFGFGLIVAVTLPLLYLCMQVTPQTLLVSLGRAAFRQALATSLLTATVSTMIVLLFGVPLAYALARLDFRGKQFVDSLVDLPIVIPQSVAGIALLVLLGPKAPVGQFVNKLFGVPVAGSALGIIVCQVFVSCPFLVRSAANAFRGMGSELENVSRTLGAPPLSTFFRVTLPLASGAIFSGCILTWARAVSEVGSLMVLAYHPLTVSVYTYDVFVQYGLKEARPAAVLLVIVCLWGFLLLRWMRTVPLGPLFGSRGAESDAKRT